MNRRQNSIAILLGLAFVQAVFAAPRNIVIFIADDLGTDLGCYGNESAETPNIDKFASESTLFRYAYATTASCSASRSVILTGLHNHATAQYGLMHGHHHFSSYANLRTLPRMLSDAGYRTARVGKFHVTPEATYAFDQALPCKSDRDVIAMVDAAKGFLTAESQQPFFLYICTGDPHRDGAPAGATSFPPNRFGNRSDGKYDGITEIKIDPKLVVVPPFLPDSPECRAELAEYLQSVARVDQGFGYLIQTLKRAGVYDDTLILFLSDNGIAMPGAKTTAYEPGIRLPCIVRLPGAKNSGMVNNALINWADITPTVLDYAKHLGPATTGQRADSQSRRASRARDIDAVDFHGRSFLSIIDQTDPAGWDEVYASHTFHQVEMYYPMRTVRERKYKLIWNIAHPLPFPTATDLWASPAWQTQYQQGPEAKFGQRTIEQYLRRPQFELYDLEQDPNELQNLADDPQFAPVLKRLKSKIKDFQAKTGDPWIKKWDYE